MVIYLPYSAEVFAFLQLLGYTHISWWWLLAFMFNDACTYMSYKNLQAKEHAK